MARGSGHNVQLCACLFCYFFFVCLSVFGDSFTCTGVFSDTQVDEYAQVDENDTFDVMGLSCTLCPSSELGPGPCGSGVNIGCCCTLVQWSVIWTIGFKPPQ